MEKIKQLINKLIILFPNLTQKQIRELTIADLLNSEVIKL